MRHAAPWGVALALGAMLACGGDSPSSPGEAAGATAPVASPSPAVTLIAPAEGAVLSVSPRSVTLQWSGPSGAADVVYAIELELGYSATPVFDPIPQDTGAYGGCAGRLRTTTCTTGSFPGAQPGRWRVTADSEAGVRLAQSSWRTFRFAPVGRTTEVFRWVLPAGTQNSVTVGPVNAGNGTLEVTLAFPSAHIVLACVGTTHACYPMGGRPMTATFEIPRELPAGPIQAHLYFNRYYPQPPGDASGLLMLTYNPL